MGGEMIPFGSGLYDFGYPLQPESPETSIGRQKPRMAANLLRDLSSDVLYKSLAESASRLVESYIGCLRDVGSQNLRESSEVNVHVDVGHLRFPFGKRGGVDITIKLK